MKTGAKNQSDQSDLSDQGNLDENRVYDLVVVGGGAAGFFGAVRFAELRPGAGVLIVEAGRRPLDKVRISGGGRCNVTHACFDPAELIQYYPRGERALRGPFSRFQPRDTMAWFEGRGVRLKTEADGRVFPVSDDSATIVNCLLEAARRAGARLVTETGIASIHFAEREGVFALRSRRGEEFAGRRVLIACGGGPSGFRLARELGHEIITPVPSLFTFKVGDARLADLAGVSVESVRLRVRDLKHESRGPLLITHEGLSGPAVLRLSSRGAREIADRSHQVRLVVDWLPEQTEDALRARLREMKTRAGAAGVLSRRAEPSIPDRLWRALSRAAGIDPDARWANLKAGELASLIGQLKSCEFQTRGKSPFKDEFVTCGGVRLSEVDFRTMESRRRPDLYFAGEILDVDALTGGFNFQNAWTTGFIAGEAMASKHAPD